MKGKSYYFYVRHGQTESISPREIQIVV